MTTPGLQLPTLSADWAKAFDHADRTRADTVALMRHADLGFPSVVGLSAGPDVLRGRMMAHEVDLACIGESGPVYVSRYNVFGEDRGTAVGEPVLWAPPTARPRTRKARKARPARRPITVDPNRETVADAARRLAEERRTAGSMAWLASE
jgi:hypothetical protein